jgi:hypothetical protein
MRLGFLVIAMLAALIPAGTAHAVYDLQWEPSLAGGGSYIALRTPGTGSTALYDFQGRETWGNQISFDNAYLHLDMGYYLTAVQMQRHPDLGYIDHHVGINLDMNRWVQRHMEDSRLTVTIGAQVSPSLPPIQTTPVPTSEAPPEGETPLPAVDFSTQQYLQQDLLQLSERTSGYSLFYGMGFNSQIDPFHRYEVGWLLSDNHTNSTLVEDSTVLHLRGVYAVHLSDGEAGVAVRHERLVISQSGGHVYTGSVFRKARHRRIVWRLEPGVSYVGDNGEYAGSFRAETDVTFPDVVTSLDYVTTLSVITLGTRRLTRSHEGTIELESARNDHYPRSLRLRGLWSDLARRAELTCSQGIRFNRAFRATFTYTSARLWWEDQATGVGWRALSDVVAFNLEWVFL